MDQSAGPLRAPDGGLTSVVLPFFNPGDELDRTLAATDAFLAARTSGWELLFVSDGSTDGSSERIAQWAASRPAQIRLIAYSPNRGKGRAVRVGLGEARGDYRIFTDIDLAYGFDGVMSVARSLWAGDDLAIASRAHPESLITLPIKLLPYLYRRHWQSKIFGALARSILRLRHSDTQAGLKGMSAAVAKRLLPRLRCDGFAFDCELLLLGQTMGYTITEAPINVRYEHGQSTIGLRQTWRMIRELRVIRRRHANAPPALPFPEQTREAA